MKFPSKNIINKISLKNYWIPLSVILVSIGLLSALFIYDQTKNPPLEDPTEANPLAAKFQGLKLLFVPDPQPVKINPLSGEFVSPFDDSNITYTVVVNNHEEARPQSGLSEAEVVYEVLAEGGITRYVAVFSGLNNIEKIGPVRSLRYYMIEIISGFNDPILLHHGWAGFDNADFETYNALSDARGAVIKWGIKSIQSAGSAYRDSQKAAISGYVHSLYTDSDRIEKEAERFTNYQSWELTNTNEYQKEFKSDSDVDKRGEFKSVEIDFLGKKTGYSSKFVYDMDSNTYLRYYGEKADIDVNNDVQIAPKNVIIEWHEFANANDGHARVTMEIVGNGTAQLFQDGEVKEIKWEKECRECQVFYTQEDGSAVMFNRGQTWVVVAVKISDNYLSNVSIQ